MNDAQQRVLLLSDETTPYEDLVEGREVASAIDNLDVDDLGGGFFKQTKEGAQYTGMIKGNEILFVHEGELEVVDEEAGTSVTARKGEAIFIHKDTKATFRGQVGTRTFWVIHPAIY
jgi:ethanolamine utilization protein EutQ (cupin superfamily)